MKHRVHRISAASLLGLLSALTAGSAIAAQYAIDPAHSSVGFAINHLVIAEVEGRFNEFQGSFTYDPAKPGASSVEAVIQAASIDTNEPKRDTHLRSEEFFHAEKFPTLTFKSSKVDTSKDGKSGKIHGVLTLHGVSKNVVLDTIYKGSMKDPWGNERTVFEASTKINRKDFGLTWNKTLETGGLLVGETVTIVLKIQGIPVKQGE